MRRNKLAIGSMAAAWALVGCLSQGPSVYVDTNAVGPVDRPSGSAERTNFELTSSIGPTSGEVFALKVTPAVRGALGREAENAKEILERARADAREALRTQLLRVNQKAVNAWQQEEQRRLDAEEKALVDAAYEAIGQKLRESAPEQGAILAELAYRIAFPLPAVAAWPPVPVDSPWRKERRADALRRQDRLVQLRRDYQSEVAGVLESTSKAITSKRAAFNRELESRLEDARSNADREADAMFLASGSAYESELAAAATQPQAALPARRVLLPGAKVPPPGSISAPADRVRTRELDREMLQHDLRIWCEEKGYRLTATQGRGRDVTKEFLEWRNTHHPGR